MTSGGNNFNYFSENQLTKFKLCLFLQLPYFCPSEDFCHAFCVAGGAFRRPASQASLPSNLFPP